MVTFGVNEDKISFGHAKFFNKILKNKNNEMLKNIHLLVACSQWRREGWCSIEICSRLLIAAVIDSYSVNEIV
jgi:hypothetical protein